MKNINYLIAAYGLSWLVLVGYLAYLQGKIRRLSRRINREVSDPDRISKER